MSIEVLAPVGDKESLKAAVYSGADAVYLGAGHFNARRNADNFDDEDFFNAVKFCKLNGVKCYLTFNILIKSNELEEAFKTVNNAYLAGIDGIIVQDLGVAEFIHKSFPDLPLHGSTQLAVLSSAALPMLKNMGFVRIVAPREFTKVELEDFCKVAENLGMEVEAFVHGALCMSVSGQCYFSAFLGGRSANRGLCAGTCRLPFSVAEKGKNVLSLKDLSLVKKVDEMKKMGVASLKIEGRMKRPEYVAEAVYTVKSALQGDSNIDDNLNLSEKLFSRQGFTDGYYVNNMGKDMFGIRTEENKEQGLSVLSSIHCLYRRPYKRLPVVFEITVSVGKQVVLKAKHMNFTICVTGPIAEKAISVPLDKEKVKSCLSKLGDTPYYLSDTVCLIEKNAAVPISVVNRLKKEALLKLDEKRFLKRSLKEITLPQKPNLFYKNVSDFFIRFSTVKQFLHLKEHLKNLVGFSLPAEEIVLYNDIKGIIDFANQNNIVFSAELPRGEISAKKIENNLLALKKKQINVVVCPDLASVYLAGKYNLEPIGGFTLNVFNYLTALELKKSGCRYITVSPELKFSEIKEISVTGVKTMAFVYGRYPLMLTRNCPKKAFFGCDKGLTPCVITDRKSEKFFLTCRNGFVEILNSKVTNISDLLNNAYFDVGYLYFTKESPEEALKVYNLFLKKSTPLFDYTRGLYKNGVK